MTEELEVVEKNGELFYKDPVWNVLWRKSAVDAQAEQDFGTTPPEDPELEWMVDPETGQIDHEHFAVPFKPWDIDNPDGTKVRTAAQLAAYLRAEGIPLREFMDYDTAVSNSEREGFAWLKRMRDDVIAGRRTRRPVER